MQNGQDLVQEEELSAVEKQVVACQNAISDTP
jgi:hypothetical protein